MKTKRIVTTNMKTCPSCGETKPLDPLNWRRDNHSSDGYGKYCKPCTQQAIKAHYRSYTKEDIARRGEVGVWCLLWSPVCKVCPCVSKSDLSECWRLAKIDPTSESYPEELNHEAP
jgi:hypothetical protein